MGRIEAPLAATLVLAATVTGCAQLRSLGLAPEDRAAEEDGMADAPVVGDLPGVAYEVAITGVPEDELQELLERSSQLVALEDRPPPSLLALHRRAEADLDRLREALRSEGFYAAEVGYEIDQGTEPPTVTVTVSTGVSYLLAEYEILYRDSAPPAPDVRPGLDDLGLHIGMPARAPAILAAERVLVETLAGRGHPFATVLERRTLVQHETTTMTVTLTVDPGPFARFGPATVDGLSRVREDYVRALLDWTEGGPYDRGKVESSRQALVATGLFESVEIAPAARVDAAGEVPMTVAVAEGKHRSIGFGASYSTSEGFGSEVFWEHRNLFGRNEQLRLTLTAAQIEQVLEAAFRKPAFLRRDQALLVEGAVANRETDAFDERSARATIGVERPWAEYWRVSAGLSGEYSIIEDEEGEDTFRLFGVPLGAARDTTDDLLDPTTGTRLRLALTPYTGANGGALLFTVASAEVSAYRALAARDRFVLAGRAKLGSLVGEETESVPANKRFFAGGGGSIRGFEFQSVGPLDEDDDPLGGRSLLEVNLEARVKLTETIGIVPFIDGGTVFDSSYPDFDETVRWAAGLGARYFSAIGPLRLDVAVPLNKRDVDDDFQFYISLGQAF